LKFIPPRNNNNEEIEQHSFDVFAKKEIKELFLVHQYDKYTCVNGMAVFPFFHVSE